MRAIKSISKTLFALVLFSFLFGCSGSKLDRSIVPAAGPAPKVEIGSYDFFTLDNGLKVILVENHKIPRISYQVFIDGGTFFEGDKIGYASIAGELLKTGTDSKSKAFIDEEIDFIGASLNTNSSGLSGSCLTKHSETLLDIMSDVLLKPSFPEEELEKSKKRRLSELSSNATDASSISNNVAVKARVGINHPYGEVITPSSIEAITREDIEAFYTKYFNPNNSYLVVVGDLSKTETIAQANKYFGEWEAQEFKKEKFEQPKDPDQNEVVFANMSGAKQSVINVTHNVSLQPGHPDAIPLSIMNGILGNGFGGRLMQNLREDKAYTYGARSSLNSDEYLGRFSATTSVRNNVTDSAITEIMYEIERMTQELVPDSTVEFIKNYRGGNFALALENPQTIARFALNIERYQLPKDYYTNYLEKLEQVTAEDVLRVAKEYLKPNNLYITVVGDEAAVANSLEQFDGNNEITFLNQFGNPVSGFIPVSPSIDVNKIASDYFAASGGLAKLRTITSLEKSGSLEIVTDEDPIKFSIKTRTENGGKYRSQISDSKIVFQQRSNGFEGSTTELGDTKAMTPEEINEISSKSDLLLLNHLNDYGISSEVLGSSDVNGVKCYVVELVYPNGDITQDFFSAENGLRLKSIDIKTVDDEIEVTETLVLDYIEKDGCTFESHLQIKNPQFDSEVKITQVKINPKFNASTFRPLK